MTHRETLDIGADTMNATLSQLLARTHQQDLNAASNHKLGASSPLEPFWGPVVIRIATAGDRRSLERLAQLDSTQTPIGATLIGELRGRPVSALALSDGKAIADPFVATSDILELLRLRAGQLNPPSRARSLQRSLRQERDDSAGSASTPKPRAMRR